MMGVEFDPGASGAPVCRWKTYPDYKDSGVEWLGEIPAHWDVNKFKRVAFYQEGPGLRNWQFTDNGIRVICVTNITENGIDFSRYSKFISFDEYIQTYKHFTVEKGDILLSSSGNSWGKVAEYSVDEKAILNTSTIRINENESHIIDRLFLKCILKVDNLREQLSILMTGSCQPNFGPSHLAKTVVPVPPLPEQRSIASFLDRKTAHIDILISKKERLITLLQEKRAALISHTVTKGLDPDVPMKDSGVEWLGEIPAHWIVTLLKRAFYVQLGKMLQSTQTSEEDTLEPYLRAANIFWNGVDISDVKKMWFSPYEKDHYLLRNDDLLISEGGDVGRSALWKGDIEYCYIQNAINRVRSREINSTQFLYYWIYVLKFNGYIDMLCNKATIAHFTAEKVEKIHIILPPSTEQRSIFAFLDCETAKLDDLTAKIQEAIEKLQEYRTALISAAITGKIDVRNENRN
jgi:type I restriction enzyme S subunit